LEELISSCIAECVQSEDSSTPVMAAHIAAPNMTPGRSDLVAELKMTHSTVHLSAISLESANVIRFRGSIDGCINYGSISRGRNLPTRATFFNAYGMLMKVELVVGENASSDRLITWSTYLVRQ